MPAATRAPKTTMRMISVTGIESSPAFLRSSRKAPSTSLSALTPNEPMKSSGCAACASSTAATTGSILRRGVVGIARDVEVDERGTSALTDLARVLRVERRADVRDRVERGDLGDDVVHSRCERRILDGQRVALDEDALAGRPFEVVVEDLVDAAGLAHARGGLLDLLGPADNAEREGDEDEAEPAEDGGLAVLRAPTPHPAGEIGRSPRFVGGSGCRLGGPRLVGLVLDDRGLHRSSFLEAVFGITSPPLSRWGRRWAPVEPGAPIGVRSARRRPRSTRARPGRSVADGWRRGR